MPKVFPARVLEIFEERGPGYVYLHTNGTYHWKPAIVVESDPMYFDSPAVQQVWKKKHEPKKEDK